MCKIMAFPFHTSLLFFARAPSLSKQKIHDPQSFATLHPSHTPHLLRLTPQKIYYESKL